MLWESLTQLIMECTKPLYLLFWLRNAFSFCHKSYTCTLNMKFWEQNFDYSPERVPLKLGFGRFLCTWRISATKKCARLSKVVCRWWTFFRSRFWNTWEMPIRKNRLGNYNGKPVYIMSCEMKRAYFDIVEDEALRDYQFLKRFALLLGVWMGKSAKHLYVFNIVLKYKLKIQKLTDCKKK